MQTHSPRPQNTLSSGRAEIAILILHVRNPHLADCPGHAVGLVMEARPISTRHTMPLAWTRVPFLMCHFNFK